MWRKNSWCLGIIIILFSNCVYAISINEIMYNPPSNLGGTYNEWIELYNPMNVSINLTDWKIADPSNHIIEILTNTTIESKGYFIFAKRPENFTRYYNVTCPIAKVAFSLNNGGEVVLLKDNLENIIDSVNYSNSFGGDGNGNSICKIGDVWKECDPTPGLENKEINLTSNKTDNMNSTNILVANKSCSFGISIFSNHTFADGKDVEFSIKVERYYGDKAIISVRGYVKDYYGESQTEYKPWTNDSILNSLTKSYSPNLKEERLYEIFYNITELNCNDIDLEDNSASKLIYVGKELHIECGKCIKCKICKTINATNDKACQTIVPSLSEKDINVSTSIEFVSKEVKERRLALYFFCIILVVMVIYFGLKNE